MVIYYLQNWNNQTNEYLNYHPDQIHRRVKGPDHDYYGPRSYEDITLMLTHFYSTRWI